MRRAPSRLAALVAAAGLAAAIGGSRAAGAAEGGDLESLLGRAFERRFGCEEVVQIELVTRNRFGESMHRRARAATKRIRGRCHAVVRVQEPPYLRGTTLLSVENPGRANDQFLFLPSLGRARRISSGRRRDAFLGTDLSYEDLERRRVSDYEILGGRQARIGEDLVQVVLAAPRFPVGYERVEFWVARRDASILEIRYYRNGTASAEKVIRAPREAIHTISGRLIPTRMEAEDRNRGTRTELRFTDVRIRHDLDDALFTVTALESGRPIPGGSDAAP